MLPTILSKNIVLPLTLADARPIIKHNLVRPKFRVLIFYSNQEWQKNYKCELEIQKHR
mgnify:CR=1 FL=1